MSVNFKDKSIQARMHEDLQRALKKPQEKRSWVMVIDQNRCIGCHACEVSCKAENVLPPGVSYRVVKEVEDGEFPDVTRNFMPTNCHQCDNPPCIEGLPEDTYTKRPDGILVFHYEKLKGSKYFEQIQGNCPYTAVYHDKGNFYTKDTPKLEPYETRDSFELGKRYNRTKKDAPQIDAVRKCHFCLHRLESGMLPACVTTCVGGAMYFGDKNDPDSLVNELLNSRTNIIINQSEGTKPRVIYLSGPVTNKVTCMSCHE